MSIPRPSHAALAALIAFGLLAGTAASAAAGRPGLLRYLDRHDRSAARLLAADLETGDVSPDVALALGDLAFMRRDFATARRALDLAAALDPGPRGQAAAVWLAWVDFEAGDRDAAETRLRRLGTSAEDAIADEAAFTLGWQQLLADRPRAAAQTFATLQTKSDGRGLAFPDAARLLEGQSLLWAGDLDAAETAFQRVVADYPSSPVSDDARRDLAWCAHLRGDDARARTLLADVSRNYRDAHFTSEGLPVVAWTTVLAEGPRALAKPLSRAYRRRPRGEPPLPFLLRIGNRSAADDARLLMRELDAPPAGVDEEPAPILRPAAAVSDLVTLPRHASSADATAAERPRSSRDRRAPSGRTALGVLLLALAAIVVMRLRRRRSDLHRREGRS